MKKFFTFYIITIILLSSCNQHAQTNSFTISIDKENLDSILQKSNQPSRIADPFFNGNCIYCLYGILKSTDNTIYQTVNYDIDQNDVTSLNGTLTFDRIALNKTYDLSVFLVENGRTRYKGVINNFQLNNDSITYKEVKLDYITDNLMTGTINIEVMNNSPEGKNIIYNGDNSSFLTYNSSVNNNTLIHFTYEDNELYPGYEDYYSLSSFLVTNGKEIPINISTSRNDDNQIELQGNVTLNTLGTYMIAVRKTEKSTNNFITTYHYIKFFCDEYDTNFVLFNNNSAWQSSTLDESILKNKPNFSTNSSSFDYCFDNMGNIYYTDGTMVYKNNKNNIICNTNIEEIFSASIKYDNITSKIWLLIKDNGFTDHIGFINNKNEFITQDILNPSVTYLNFIPNGKNIYFITSDENNYVTKEIKICNYDTYNLNFGEETLLISGNSSDYGGGPISYYVNDALLLNNNIYALFDVDCRENQVFRFGLLIKYSLENDTVEYLGATKELKIEDKIINYDYNDISAPNEEKTFITPKKIIAIKPKELYIADDGITFNWNTNSYKFKNVNRFHKVNLDSFTIESSENLNKVKWFQELSDYTTYSGVRFTEE